MPNTDRDVYAERLEQDRKIRRHAASLIGELHCLPYAEAVDLINEVRGMVRIMDGQPLAEKISADAAAFYARLPLVSPSVAMRTLHLLELWIGFVETGFLNVEEASSVAVIVGTVPLAESAHIKQGAVNDCSEVLVAPRPRLQMVKKAEN